MPIFDPCRGRTKTGQLSAYAADNRPWGGADPHGFDYVYAPDRKAARPLVHVDGFKGILQVDGYAGPEARREERRLIRQQKSGPLGYTFQQWLCTKLGLISPEAQARRRHPLCALGAGRA